MIDTFRIGDGELTTTGTVRPVYVKYSDLGFEMDEDFFYSELDEFNVYYEAKEIPNIQFRPKSIKGQDTSDYYFLKVEVKIPRSNIIHQKFEYDSVNGNRYMVCGNRNALCGKGKRPID